MHAGEAETSHTLITHPDLVHQDRAGQESGADLKRLHLPPGLYTGIWWYASFPEHYSGNGAAGNTALGNFDVNAWVHRITDVTKAVKADSTSLELQNEFFKKSEHPLDTKQ